MSKVKDNQTVDMFAIPVADIIIPGKSHYAREVALTASQMLADAGITDRYKVCADISRLAEKDVSKHMLDAYCAPSRLDHSLPFWMGPILEQICSRHDLTDWLVGKRGGRVAYGADAVDAEIGKMELMKGEMLREMNNRLKDLKRLKGSAGHD